MLKNFKIDTGRDLLVPDFECYQMDLSGPVDAAIASGEVGADFAELPSWSKFSANPIKAKGFFTRTLEALFLGQGGHDELNVDLQTSNYRRKGPRVAMMFLSANNAQLEMAGEIARDALSGFEIIVLCGSVKYNGKKITNRTAEKTVKEIVERGSSVLIVASGMAQRSFSVPEITELYLAYDKGQNGATIQKMSRTLTPGTLDKVGRIFSLSFDPNRDDKFDAMVVETAINYKKRHNGKSLTEAMREVLRTIDIYKCAPDGAIKIDKDAYLEAAMARKGISRVLGKRINIGALRPEDITALATGNSDYFRAEKQKTVQTGKTRDAKKKAKGAAGPGPDASAKELAKVREVLTTVLENLDIIILGTGNTILVDAMAMIDNDEEMQQCVEEEFGVCFDTLQYLFSAGIIKQEWAELLYDNG